MATPTPRGNGPARRAGTMPPPTGKLARVRVPALAKDQVQRLKDDIKALTQGVAPETVKISRPRMRHVAIAIAGIAPYVQHAFSEKQRKQMEETQRQGQQAKGKRKREPKNFEAIYEAAKHKAKVKPGEKAWCGIPAPAFRNAMISACRLVGFAMTRAKLSIFVDADGYDAEDSTPLVRIVGEPRIHQAPVRNESGVADIRWRPMWDQWSATVRITWDEDQFSATDVANLMMRAGLQVGIGEGRPDSPNSNGLGWGRFEVVEG